MKTGEIIGQTAREKNINLRQLAQKAGVPYNTLYAIVKRKSDRIEPRTLRRIAAALECDPYSLMSFDMASDAVFDRINAMMQIHNDCERLNDEGVKLVAELVRMAAESPRYCLPAVPPPSAGGTAGLEDAEEDGG